MSQTTTKQDPRNDQQIKQEVRQQVSDAVAAAARPLYAPVSLEDREAELEAIRKDQREHRGRMLDCLDPTEAKRHEDRKPLYEWNVKARLFRPARGKELAHMDEVQKHVVAHNERDAWAMFCDSTGEWPSIQNVQPEITRLKRRTLRDAKPSDEDRD